MLRLCTKDEMQGAEDAAEGSVLTYVTETEFRKQRGRSPSCNSRSIGIGHPRSGDRCANTRLNPLDPLRVAEQKFPFPTPPLRSSHSPANLIVRHPCGVAGVVCDARSPLFAMSRLTSVLLKCVTPCRSCGVGRIIVRRNRYLCSK